MTYEKLKPYMAGAELYGNHTRRLSPPAFIDEKEAWYRMSKRPEFENAESLARLLSEKSHLFEKKTEEGTTVRKAMVIIGITHYHHIQGGFLGTAEKAWRVFRAFQMSDCSEEVRLLVLKVAATLHLGEAYRSRDEI